MISQEVSREQKTLFCVCCIDGGSRLSARHHFTMTFQGPTPRASLKGAMQRRPRLPVPVVTPDQRKVLEQWTRRSTSAQALALRARMVLRLADGHSSTAVAQHFRVHIQTVSKWRERFGSRGVDGLLDEPRPGQPRKITDAQIEAVITRTLENKPADATHWSTRSMAKATRLNQTAISRI